MVFNSAEIRSYATDVAEVERNGVGCTCTTLVDDPSSSLTVRWSLGYRTLPTVSTVPSQWLGNFIRCTLHDYLKN